MWAGWGLRWFRLRGTRRASEGTLTKDGGKLKNKRRRCEKLAGGGGWFAGGAPALRQPQRGKMPHLRMPPPDRLPPVLPGSAPRRKSFRENAVFRLTRPPFRARFAGVGFQNQIFSRIFGIQNHILRTSPVHGCPKPTFSPPNSPMNRPIWQRFEDYNHEIQLEFDD